MASVFIGLGFAIGFALDSGLLGFIGADFAFLLIMAFYTTVQDSANRKQF